VGNNPKLGPVLQIPFSAVTLSTEGQEGHTAYKIPVTFIVKEHLDERIKGQLINPG